MKKDDFFKQVQDTIFEMARTGGKRLSVLLAALLKKMETTGGVLKSSTKNNRLLSEILKTIRLFYKNQSSTLSKFIKEQLTELVEITALVLGKQAKKVINKVKYLDALLTDFGFSSTAVVNATTPLGNLLKDDVVSKTIIATVTKAIREGSIIKDVIKKVISFFLPDKGLGIVESQIYHKGGFNLFQQQDRILSDAMADDLGLNFAVYAGTLKDTTRQFCRARLNKVYTKGEIRSWDKLNWSGKKANQNSLIDCGGWNCRHHLNFVSEETAKRLASTRGGINSYH